MCYNSNLKSNNILCTNQFGFRKDSNTSDAIIEFLDYVYSSLDSKQSTIAVYLDFSKAFDTVINILMSKLLHNGVRGVMQHWFESYLSNRKQAIRLNQKLQLLCQTLHCVFHKGRCWAQYSFFCMSMTCLDPQIRWV